MNGAISKDLIRFVAFARDKNEVAATRHFQSLLAGFAPIGFDDAFGIATAHSGQNSFNNFLWVFRARVVAGDNTNVRQARGDKAHLRTLGAVAVAAAAEDSNQAARRELFHSGDDVL